MTPVSQQARTMIKTCRQPQEYELGQVHKGGQVQDHGLVQLLAGAAGHRGQAPQGHGGQPPPGVLALLRFAALGGLSLPGIATRGITQGAAIVISIAIWGGGLLG